MKFNSRFLDNKIGNKGVRIIAKAIKYNTALEELDLSGMQIFFVLSLNASIWTDNNIGDDAVLLADALKSNSALKKLNLDGMKIVPTFVLYLRLRFCYHVITSDLLFYSGNNINSNILAKIKKELRRNNNPMHIKEKERRAKLKNMSLVQS